MTWRSRTWVRWLGWTALYGLSGAALITLLPLAFLIGLRFRSWWWIAGALVGSSLSIVLIIVIDILQTAQAGGSIYWDGVGMALGLIFLPLMLFSPLAAAAGVGVGKWWGERQR